MNEPQVRTGKRFEWSALFAVAFLLATLAPGFAASAVAVSPSLAPAAVISAVPSQSCQAVWLWYQATQNSAQIAKTSLHSTPHFSRNAATSVLGIEAPVLTKSANADETHAQKSIRPSFGGHPEFGRTFLQSPAALVPSFTLSRTHAAYRFALALHAHESAFLSGTRTNHYDE